MAISKNGFDDGFRGKFGNAVTYILNGKLVKRRIGKTNKAPKPSALSSWQITSLTNEFLQPIQEFIEIGFELEAKRTSKNYHNMACSYNRLNAISGEYPKQYIDFSRALVTKGSMPVVQQVDMKVVDEGLQFTWNTDLVKGMRWNDSAMVMAYFPEIREAKFIVNGANRNLGVQILKLPRYREPRIIETYHSFIAANHKSISNSIYTGKFVW